MRGNDRPSIAELQRAVGAMTRAPWTTPTGTRFLGAVSATRRVAALIASAPVGCVVVQARDLLHLSGPECTVLLGSRADHTLCQGSSRQFDSADMARCVGSEIGFWGAQCS
jgi:hypothetical protein